MTEYGCENDLINQETNCSSDKLIKYGFIGAGHMGGALVRALVKTIDPAQVMVSVKSSNRAQMLHEESGTKVSDINSIINECDYIFLGIKPQGFQQLLTDTGRELRQRKDKVVIISMAAGVSIESICSYIGSEMKVIRTMPNTPVEVGKGMILYSTSSSVAKKEEKQFLYALDYAGLFEKVDEKLIDAGCALSGCGPAFVFKFMKALADGGMKCGLSESQSVRLAMQTVVGSAALAQSSSIDLETLKNNVCSPKGSTIEGVEHLESLHFDETVQQAVMASYKRTLELGK